MKRRPTVPDEALWHAVAQTVEPLARAKKRVAKSDEQAAPERKDRAQSHGSVPVGPAPRAPKPGGGKQAPALGHGARAKGLNPPAPPSAPPPLAGFERRKARRIAAGVIDIEDRIDLHGYRQSEAYHRLAYFIRDCAARGLSTVLVITGKGGRRETVVHRTPGVPRHPWDEPWGDLDARDHGVLRRSVPMWLAEPELRAHIVSFTKAGLRHGGTGALYVHLRRRARSAFPG